MDLFFNDNEELNNCIKEELLNYLYEKSDVMPFIYDINQRTITCSERIVSYFNCSSLLKIIPDSIINNYVYENDRQKLKALFNDIENGKDRSVTEFKNISMSDHYLLELKIIQRGNESKPLFALGLLRNITNTRNKMFSENGSAEDLIRQNESLRDRLYKIKNILSNTSMFFDKSKMQYFVFDKGLNYVSSSLFLQNAYSNEVDIYSGIYLSEVINKIYGDKLNNNIKKTICNHAEECLKTKKHINYEYKNSLTDRNQITYNVDFFPAYDRSNEMKGIIITISNPHITENSQIPSVLFVDDSKSNLVVAKSLIKPYGFNCDFAESGKEALEYCKNNSYDLIFMDHLMPEMDGIETMNEIKKCHESKDISFVALTANASSREEYLSMGFNDYLAKPIVPDELDKVIVSFFGEMFSKKDFIKNENKFNNSEQNNEILKQVYRDGVKKITLLKKLIQENDFYNYQIEVHALKSVLAAVGETTLSLLAKEQENIAKEKNELVLQKEGNNFVNIFSKYIENLSVNYSETNNFEQSLPALRKNELIAFLEKIKKSLQDYDLEKLTDLCRDLLIHKESEAISKIVENCVDAAESYDYQLLNTNISKLEETINSLLDTKLVLFFDMDESIVTKSILHQIQSENDNIKMQISKSIDEISDNVFLLIINLSEKNINQINEKISSIENIKLYLIGSENEIENTRNLLNNENITGIYKRPVNARLAGKEILKILDDLKY